MSSVTIPKGEVRSFGRIRHHYEIEIELAKRLRDSRKEDRALLYSSLYTQLLQLVPDHPQLTRRSDVTSRSKVVHQQIRLLSRFLTPESVFVELGAGDAALSVEVANRVKKVYAIDVSVEPTRTCVFPPNVEFLLSDGCSVPVPMASANVIFSNQLMEHLHPEDALDQLRHVYETLVPGGVYICFTPHRFSGPHDVSRYFDDVATGFHLKEYTNGELQKLFLSIGFSEVKLLIGGKGRYVYFPASVVCRIETSLNALRQALRTRLSNSLLLRSILGIRLLAIK